MSGDYSVLFSQKTSTGFLYYWDYIVGTGLSEVYVGLFCACFLNKMLNLTSFTACIFSLNLGLQRKKILLLWNCAHIVPIILKLFS